MKRLLTTLLILCFCSLQAQYHKFAGRVNDKLTGLPIYGANVHIPELNLGESTNYKGEFELFVPQGTYQVEISYLGYGRQMLTLSLQTDTTLQLTLVPEDVKLQATEIVAALTIIDTTEVHQSMALAAKEISRIPTLLGEPDVLKSIQLLPGVQGGTEGTSRFHVRGGSPDQNLILMDGVPVYNASHLFGFFSTFNADVIQDVELLKRGFPARYGGRLSSVLNVNLKDGNLEEYHGGMSLGIIAPKLYLEGPLIKNKTSFILSGRRSIYDLVVVPFYDNGQQLFYYFGDFNTKLKHVISDKDEIILSYFHSTDKFKYEYEDPQIHYSELSGIKWRNHTASAVWQHQFSPRLSADLLVSYNHYKFTTHSQQEWPTEVNRVNYQSQIEDIGARYDLSFQLHSNHTLRLGTGYTYHTFKPGAVQYYEEYFLSTSQQNQDLSRPIYSNEVTAYAEDTWEIASRWHVNGGLHYAMYNVENSQYTSLQPRLTLNYSVKDNWNIVGSYSKMTQFLHLLSNTGLGVPTDLWVSATDEVKPQQSQQYAIGSTKYFKKKAWQVTTEVYYKSMYNLIEYKEGASYITLTDWQNVVETDGTGEAIGLEILFKKSKGKTTGWVSYTLASTTRTFSGLNNGQTFPYRYDRLHDISIVLHHRFNEKIDVSANWVYQSGIAFTGPQGRFWSSGVANGFVTTFEGFEDISDRNALRYPAYHRLDLAINLTKQKKRTTRIWSIGIYNAYNRNNPFYIDLKENAAGEIKIVQVSLFPIIPSLNYRIQF